jgi:predicted GNAT family acetyltransferase
VSVVRDNTELNRFEMDTEAGLAIADYRLNGFTMTIYHTEVPARLRGRGHGGRLVMGALSEARSKGYKIVPSCWFVSMSASSKYDDLWADRSSK